MLVGTLEIFGEDSRLRELDSQVSSDEAVELPLPDDLVLFSGSISHLAMKYASSPI